MAWVERVACSVCFKVTAGRLPTGGDGSEIQPRPHKKDGKLCLGRKLKGLPVSTTVPTLLNGKAHGVLEPLVHGVVIENIAGDPFRLHYTVEAWDKQKTYFRSAARMKLIEKFPSWKVSRIDTLVATLTTAAHRMKRMEDDADEKPKPKTGGLVDFSTMLGDLAGIEFSIAPIEPLLCPFCYGRSQRVATHRVTIAARIAGRARNACFEACEECANEVHAAFKAAGTIRE